MHGMNCRPFFVSTYGHFVINGGGGGCLTRVWHVGWPHDPPDLLHGLEIGTEAAMATKDLLVDDGCDRQTVEAVRERLPQFDVESPLAC